MLCPHHSDATPAISNERGMSPSLIVTSGRACAHCARSCPYLRRKVFFSESRPRRTQRCCFSNLCEVNHHKNYRKTKFFLLPQSDTHHTPVSSQWRSCGGCWPYSQRGSCICTCARTPKSGRLRTRLAHVTAGSSRTRADVAQQTHFCSPCLYFIAFRALSLHHISRPTFPPSRARRARVITVRPVARLI